MATLVDEGTYPSFTRLVKSRVPTIINRKKEFDVFLAFADFYGSEDAAKRALYYGDRPWVEVTDISGCRAGLNIDGYDDFIFINVGVVQQFETIAIMRGAPEISRRDWEDVWESVQEVLSALVLHEIVHWHDKVDREKKFGKRPLYPGRKLDAGDLFEIDAYRIPPSQDLYNGALDGWLGWSKENGGCRLYDPVEKILPVIPADALFAFDSADLKPEAVRQLDTWADVFSRLVGRRVAIVGHTDSTGKGPYNQDLSLRRARAVQFCLLRKGVGGAMFATVEGKGETEPIASNATADGRRRNRRVEFRLLKD